MINVDLSKMLHPRVWDLVVPAFMPGLAFNTCILCARPEYIYEFANKAHLDHFALTAIALIIAFILGTAFILWVRLIGVGIAAGYVQGRRVWRKLLEHLLRTKCDQSSRVVNSYHKLLSSDEDLRSVQRAGHKATAELLKRIYGIDPPSPGHPSEWKAWNAALGRSRPESRRGVMFMMATQATGWSALAAAYLAPALRNLPYFCGIGASDC